jgi:F-type H+-transporting ATPase subunit b
MPKDIREGCLMSLLNRKWSGKKGPIKMKAIMVLVIAGTLFVSSGSVFGASEGGHGESQASKGWVKTDTLRVMNFAVLAIALFFLLRKPVAQALSGRIKEIQDQLNELEAKKKEAEKSLVEYDKKLSQLEKESETIIAGYKRQGEEAKARILKEAESAAVKLEDQAKHTIEHEFKIAKLKLQEDILEEALKKAEEIVKGSITSDDQDRLVDEYLDKVVVQ